VPIQLELVVEMWVESRKIPQNLDGLYSHFLGHVLDEAYWSSRGQGDYPQVLAKLAFDMMTGKRPFNPKIDFLPEELKAELVQRKLLIGSGEVMEFRHDRIRGYLAAEHFRLKRETLLASDRTEIDPNWDAMFEFYLASEKEADKARTLLLFLAKTQLDSAVELNAWGLSNRPEIFVSWQNEFINEVGKIKVAGGTS
jgi:hypothetical protein